MISFSLEYKLIRDFGIYHMVFRYARHNSVAGNYIGHCIVGKIQDGHHYCKVKLYKLPSFSTEWTEKHNFDVYHRFFRYSRHSVWLDSTLDIALWVKSKMYVISENQKKKNIIVNRMGNTHVGFSYIRSCDWQT